MTSPFEDPYNGWVMPVAVRATSGHSKDMSIPLDPMRLFKRLDLIASTELARCLPRNFTVQFGVDPW